MKKARFAMKRYKDNTKTALKQIQLNKKMLKRNGLKKTKKQSNRKRIEEYIKQHGCIKKRIKKRKKSN